MKKKIIFSISLFLFFAARPVLAHCPLCTLGAGAMAIGATWLGVSTVSVGLFIGAGAIAMGLWAAKLLKKKYVPCQTQLIALVSFLSTVWPVQKVLPEAYYSVYISLAGDFGSWLNRTYIINRFFLGGIIGAALMFAAPYASRKISALRNGKTIPYQGIILAFSSLLAAAAIIELWIIKI